MSLVVDRPAAAARQESLSSPWRPAADRRHGGIAAAVLSGTAIVALALPAADAVLLAWGGALLLVGGALIGVPHGSSDFVTAHRLMRSALGRRWLPTFLAAYLALAGMAMAGWMLAPLATLIGFLALSGLHFGYGDARVTAPSPLPSLAFAVRATTPVLPIFLIHPAGVAGFLAALGSVDETGALHLLLALRWPLLVPWSAALVAVVLPSLVAGGRPARDAAELLAIAFAAAVLPPLLAFGLYFCLVHAVRHMLDLAEDHHPRRPLAAATLAAAVVAPSALACFVALVLSWDRLAGLLDTQALVTLGLRVVAALTLPHMALDWAAGRHWPARS